MIRNLHRQQGITFMGFLIVAAVIVAFILFGLRLFPLYNEKMKVMSVMEYVASQPNAATMSQAEVWKLFYNNADIQGITVFPHEKDMKQHVLLEKNPEGSGTVIRVYFEMRNPLFDDIELILDFDEYIPMGGQAG